MTYVHVRLDLKIEGDLEYSMAEKFAAAVEKLTMQWRLPLTITGREHTIQVSLERGALQPRQAATSPDDDDDV